MPPDTAAHRRANAEQIRLLEQELAAQAPRHPAWLATALWGAATAAALALYAALRLPGLPLILDAAVTLAVWAWLGQTSWPLPVRYGASVLAGLVAALAVWRG